MHFGYPVFPGRFVSYFFWLVKVLRTFMVIFSLSICFEQNSLETNPMDRHDVPRHDVEKVGNLFSFPATFFCSTNLSRKIMHVKCNRNL